MIFSLLATIILWGGNNTGIKYIVGYWPPIWTGCSRFLLAGLILMGLLHGTNWFGPVRSLTPAVTKALWWRTSFSLAAYIVVFNWALTFTSASHVALYLGASPVWALLMESPPNRTWQSLQRYLAAGLAMIGVIVLFLPTLKLNQVHWVGELLGMACGFLWAFHGRQCHQIGGDLTGVEITAHTMWRAGLWLTPLALIEVIIRGGIPWHPGVVAVQGYCILFGGVAAFVLWNNSLRVWSASKCFLFNNLIPLSTMAWAHACLKEPVTPTYFIAMTFIIAGVVLSQSSWIKLLGTRWMPEE
ncbi:MAG: DMT family transporter [Verrucomicrobiota bacterium]